MLRAHIRLDLVTVIFVVLFQTSYFRVGTGPRFSWGSNADLYLVDPINIDPDPKLCRDLCEYLGRSFTRRSHRRLSRRRRGLEWIQRTLPRNKTDSYIIVCGFFYREYRVFLWYISEMFFAYSHLEREGEDMERLSRDSRLNCKSSDFCNWFCW